MSANQRSRRSTPVDSHVSLRFYAPQSQRLAKDAANTDAPVLITGETGTGKSLLAAIIHQSSTRGTGPFKEINCSNLQPALLESELFGHEKGAYTDARVQRTGLVEEANHGTLFLDEIGEMAVKTQAQLLKMLESDWIRRVGSSREIRVDVRVICATNSDLEHAMANGRFRADLFYRCSVLPIRLHPLRHRRKVLPGLIDHVLQHVTDRYAKGRGVGISPDALNLLVRHSWPGNVRELSNVLTRSVLRARDTITAEIVQEFIANPIHLTLPAAHHSSGNEKRARYVAPADRDDERHNIIAGLRRSGGNKSRAASELGMSRQILYERMRLYDITGEEWRS